VRGRPRSRFGGFAVGASKHRGWALLWGWLLIHGCACFGPREKCAKGIVVVVCLGSGWVTLPKGWEKSLLLGSHQSTFSSLLQFWEANMNCKSKKCPEITNLCAVFVINA